MRARAKPASAGSAPAAQRHGVRPAVTQMLNLQRLAGNQAVAAMVQREKKKGESTGVATVTSKQLGTIRVEGVHFGSMRRGSGRASESEEDGKRPGEISFTSRSGKHSSRLFRASSGGLAGDGAEVTVTMPGMTVTLTGVLVSSYSVVGSREKPYEHWSLNFEDSAFEMAAKK